MTRRELLRGSFDDSGASSIEMALLGALVAVVIIGALRLVGVRNRQNFRKVEKAFPKRNNGGGGGGGNGGKP